MIHAPKGGQIQQKNKKVMAFGGILVFVVGVAFGFSLYHFLMKSGSEETDCPDSAGRIGVLY